MDYPCPTCIVRACCQAKISTNDNIQILELLTESCQIFKKYFPYDLYYYTSEHMADGIVWLEEFNITKEEWEKRYDDIEKSKIIFNYITDDFPPNMNEWKGETDAIDQGLSDGSKLIEWELEALTPTQREDFVKKYGEFGDFLK